MIDKKKKCSGFPSKPKTECQSPATAVVCRLPVCADHAREAEGKGLRVQHVEKKS